MAEARSEEEEENMMRGSREQVVRRQPNSSGGRPDRRKPEHRHSQGPLSSIRAAIKRTSNRSTSVSETPRDRDRERDRDRDRDRERDRDRRRPEITILSAEPLASTSWFPGAAAGFPPPPPPAAQIWGPTIPPAIQPPPSYEEVIREKTQEQVLLPSSSASSSPSSQCPVPTKTTIATQTDTGSASDPEEPQVQRPVRPPRPPLPLTPKLSHADKAPAAATNQPAPTSFSCTSVATNTQCCELLADLLLSTTSGSPVDDASPPSTSSHVPVERPRPRPRSKLGIQPISREVKVQTLVKLREDGLATLAARNHSDSASQEASQGKYLQELLEAFSSDDWGFPDHRSDSSGLSQSESEEEEEGEEEEDMATLRARIQAFEQQQQQQVGDGSVEGGVVTKKPEPRPRPRLQPTKSAPPIIAPKPKSFSHGLKPSSKVFWEDGASTSEPGGADRTGLSPKLQTATEPPSTAAQPSATPKPQSDIEPFSSGAPVPAPRPPPPKLTASVGDASNPKPPPRPAVAPRASSVVALHQDKSAADGRTTPTLPPRPSVEIGSGAPSETESDATHGTAIQTVKVGNVRPGVPTKPAALTSPRRASAPNLAPKPTGVSPAAPDPNTVPAKPTAAAPTVAPKPSGPAPAKPPTPAPALRKGPALQTKAEPTNSANPTSSDPPLPPRPSSVKLLPLRPPPIKSIPGRPPPPATTNQIPPPSKTTPANQPSSSSQTPPTPSLPANQIQAQKAPKKGPPLPPRPKPGHPLYNSYVKQEVLIVLDDPTPSPSEPLSGEEKVPSTVTPPINPSQCLLDLDTQPEPVQDQDTQLKSGLEGLSISDSQSILPVQPSEQKEQPDPPPVSGPRCVAVFDYEGEEEDELTFSQGDVISLLELVGEEWGRGQIHGRIGIFPLNFAEVVEPLPQPATVPGETDKPPLTDTSVTSVIKSIAPKKSQIPDMEAEEWAVALFDFPGQTAEDLSFHKGAMILVTEHIDAEWRRGKLDGREGLYPAAFTQPCQAQPIPDQESDVKGVAKALFDFTAESEDELTLKVGDIITQVESLDEQWIMGVVGGKRGIVPKNYISLF